MTFALCFISAVFASLLIGGFGAAGGWDILAGKFVKFMERITKEEVK